MISCGSNIENDPKIEETFKRCLVMQKNTTKSSL